METKPLIDTQFVLDNTSIQQNAINNLTKYILDAQRLYLEFTFGVLFIRNIKDNEDNGRIVPNSLEERVLELIKLALANYSVSIAIPMIHYKITGIGVVVKAEEANISLEAKDLQYLVTLYKQNGQRYLDEAVSIVNSNIYSFPSYIGANCEDKPKPSKTYGGIIFRY